MESGRSLYCNNNRSRSIGRSLFVSLFPFLPFLSSFFSFSFPFLYTRDASIAVNAVWTKLSGTARRNSRSLAVGDVRITMMALMPVMSDN